MPSSISEEKNIRYKMFQAAEMHAYTASLILKTLAQNKNIEESKKEFAKTAFSVALLSSFALEVYLKCLLRMRGITDPKKTKIHNCEDLFLMLRSVDQRRIRSLYKQRLTNDPRLKTRPSMRLKKIRFMDVLR